MQEFTPSPSQSLLNLRNMARASLLLVGTVVPVGVIVSTDHVQFGGASVSDSRGQRRAASTSPERNLTGPILIELKHTFADQEDL